MSKTEKKFEQNQTINSIEDDLDDQLFDALEDWNNNSDADGACVVEGGASFEKCDNQIIDEEMIMDNNNQQSDSENYNFSDVDDNQLIGGDNDIIPMEDDYCKSDNESLNGNDDRIDLQLEKSHLISPMAIALRKSKIQQSQTSHKSQSEWAKGFPWDDEVTIANTAIFGNDNFRENQREIINATKSGKDVLALIPTGGGKSLTFQLSAVTDNGVTFVIMPLLSLIEDNLSFVENLGIPACSLSTQSTSQKEEKRVGALYSDIKMCKIKLVYLTPERLVKSPGLMATIDYLYNLNKIDRFVIDEVHCVSHWGQDFRKDYLNLDFLKERYPTVPLLCLTATATIQVKDDIVKRLKIEKSHAFFQSSFNRPNLIYEIRDKKQFKNINDDLVQMLKSRFKNKSGIIYCISRKECEKLSEILRRNYGIKCDFYHAELSYNKRKEIQDKWMRDELQIIIATIAFGMGINKKDVRFVIHYSMPKSLEGYVQECGRAGRDQKPAECILYYNYGDRKRNDFFIVTNKDNTGSRKNENIHALYTILEYCEEPFLCRRKMQLSFLGEDFDQRKCNKMCDNCRRDLQVVEVDKYKEAQIILKLVKQCFDYKARITYKQVTELLRGKKPKKNFLRPDLQQYYSGKLQSMNERDIKRLIISMLIMRILKEQFETQMVRGINVKNIHVYLVPGKRQELLRRLENGQLPVMMTDGIKMSEKLNTFEQDNLQDFSINDYKAEELKQSSNSMVNGQRNYVKQKSTPMAENGLKLMDDKRPLANEKKTNFNTSNTFNYGFDDNPVRNSYDDSLDKEPNNNPTTSQYSFKKDSSYKQQSTSYVQPQAASSKLTYQPTTNPLASSINQSRSTFTNANNNNNNVQNVQDLFSDSMLDTTKNSLTYQPLSSKPQTNGLSSSSFTLQPLLKEELRQRMYLVKTRLLAEANDEQHIAINSTFTNSEFKTFIQFASDGKKDGKEVLNYLKIGKSQPQKNLIDKYGNLFMEEFNHFMKNIKVSPLKNEFVVPEYKQQSNDDTWYFKQNSQKIYKEELSSQKSSKEFKNDYGFSKNQPTYEKASDEEGNQSDEESQNSGDQSNLEVIENEFKFKNSKKRKYNQISGGASNIPFKNKKRKKNKQFK